MKNSAREWRWGNEVLTPQLPSLNAPQRTVETLHIDICALLCYNVYRQEQAVRRFVGMLRRVVAFIPWLFREGGCCMAYSKKKIKAEYDLFAKKYARKKSRNGGDPNDRHYDRKLEEKIKRMKPEDLAEILNHEED